MTDTTPAPPPRSQAELLAELEAMDPEQRARLFAGVTPPPAPAADPFQEALRSPAQRGEFTTPTTQTTTGLHHVLRVDGVGYAIRDEIPGDTMAQIVEVYALQDRAAVMAAVRPVLQSTLTPQAWIEYQARTKGDTIRVPDGEAESGWREVPPIKFDQMAEHMLFVVEALVGRPTERPASSG